MGNDLKLAICQNGPRLSLSHLLLSLPCQVTVDDEDIVSATCAAEMEGAIWNVTAFALGAGPPFFGNLGPQWVPKAKLEM